MSEGREAKILVWARELRSWSILINPGPFFGAISARICICAPHLTGCFG